MISARNPDGSRRPIPGWFVVLAVALTLVVTVFVMLKRHPERWPARNAEMPTWVAQSTSPAMAAAGPQGQYRVIAAAQAIPPIHAGTPPGHEDRGACALCHQVVDAVGRTIPTIHAYSALPHPFRGGLCINCHRTIPAPAHPSFLPMAATGQVGGNAQPTEAAWAGMEVSPITQVTASQYNIPAGIQGVVVAEAEGKAGAAGVRAGDVVVAVNNTAITDMGTFAAATQNGRLAGGSMHVLRGGRFVEVVIDQPGAAQQPAAAAPSPSPPPVQAYAAAPLNPNLQQARVQGPPYPAPGAQARAGGVAGQGTTCPNRF